MTRSSTTENRAHLAPAFLAEMQRAYAGTRVGRQELDGELLAEQEGALWTRAVLESCRAEQVPDRFRRLVVAVDPPVSQGPDADACGIVAAGLDPHGAVTVLEDASVQGKSPLEWMRRALDCYAQWRADRLVAEVNNGGDLVETLARQIDPHVAFRAVRATRGKLTRAEPVAALYERGLVRHAQPFPALEDEMVGYDGSGPSPDRLDALVWAVTDLLQGRGLEPRVLSL